MAEYSRMAKGSFTATGTSAIVTLPFQPDYVELWNYTNIATAGTHRVTRAWWDNKLVVGTSNPTMIELYAGSSSSVVFDTVQTNGISTFSAGQLLQYGPTVQHTATVDFSIAQSGAGGAGPATTITVAGAGIPDHGLNTGDVVIFGGLFQTTTTGMQQIANIPFVVTRISATQFSIFWDTSGTTYAAFNTNTNNTVGNRGWYKKVLYPNLYLPQDLIVAGLTLAATTTVKTTIQHNLHVGQEVAFRIPTIWGPTQLNSLPDLLIPGQPIYGYVQSITDFQTFVVNINSTGYTAFNANFAAGAVLPTLQGVTYAQVVAVGDVNTGGNTFNGGALYPPPRYSYASNDDSNTINGPAILGSFINNTSQGFVIGGGAAAVDTATTSMIASTNVVYWHAYMHDMSIP